MNAAAAIMCLVSVVCCKDSNGTEPEEKPDDKDSAVETVINRLWNETSYKETSVARIKALDQMQAYADKCENSVFKTYINSTNETECRKFEQGYGILDFYNKAFDHVMDDVKATEVPAGGIVLWQLYNMGYIVKTPDKCVFGIDICHRRGAELVQYLDFALVTHMHADHYTDAFLNAMASAGKPVYTNFRDNGYEIPGQRQSALLKARISAWS